MKIEVGHKDMLEFILLGTGQDTVGEAKKYIEENKLLGDLVQSMNNPQMWKVDRKSVLTENPPSREWSHSWTITSQSRFQISRNA
jgi:hypothetical protein